MTHLQIIVLIPQCCKLFFAAERNTIVDWNEIFAMLNQLLTNTMTTEVIFLRLPAICEPRVNHVAMREYYILKNFLYDTPSANFYYRNETKDDFEATITQTLFFRS